MTTTATTGNSSTYYSTLISRRRHIAPPAILQQHGFDLLLCGTQGDEDDGAVVVGLQTSVLQQDGALQLTTLQGPMAAEAWLDKHTHEAEDLAQPITAAVQDHTTQQQQLPRRRRRINLPEIVFPQALVKIQLMRQEAEEQTDGNSLVFKTSSSLQWTVDEPLREWAKAHEHLSLPSDKDDDMTISAAYRGVSILQSADAALWSTKKKKNARSGGESSLTDVAVETTTTTDFHYDWTYSTPYTVSLLPDEQDEEGSSRGGTPTVLEWFPLQESGMVMTLLQDRTQPILYFDEIVLWEDDLHDNGESQLSIKVRVMPFGIFVLSRLVVRVDGVRVRVRDTRVLIMLREGKSSEQDDIPTNFPRKIYRDVVWREASWSDLAGLGLPTSVREWTVPATAAALFGRLPEVELPSWIIKHAVLKAAGA